MRHLHERLSDEDEPLTAGSVNHVTMKLSKPPKVLGHAMPDDDTALHPGHFKRKTKLPTPVWLADCPADDIASVRGSSTDDNNAPTLQHRLTTEVTAFVAYTNAEIEAAQASVQESLARLNACLEKQWPTAHATCFGSFASGLWLPSSDVDVVVQGIPTSLDDVPRRPLDTIETLLRTESWVGHVSVVGTKVTVLKVILKACGRRMDIAVETADTQQGLAATEILRAAVSSMPHMRPLVLVLKTFLREKGLNNAFTGGLSSYALVLLCLHYMLSRPPAAEEDVGALVLGFLEYYGTMYDHTKRGITWFVNPLGHLESVEYERKTSTKKCELVLDDPIHPDDRGVYNVGASAYAMVRVVAALENAFYAIEFHRTSRFTPTPLSQMIHWSGPAPLSTA
ncbi:Aste57867_2623 [Aphanomyces stellatus]|uniref:Aste57867_2623 protein n=1 Tax=Aphanomyces stellatus TaxID=120398 RepID=A0A485KBQ1_9STRA|nr:hypothetical protein As57867_002616 [Aphanomyces stellatus]VFT79819.1 Aste57867_2623 [Aphanomyces stellatus]